MDEIPSILNEFDDHVELSLISLNNSLIKLQQDLIEMKVIPNYTLNNITQINNYQLSLYNNITSIQTDLNYLNNQANNTNNE